MPKAGDLKRDNADEVGSYMQDGVPNHVNCANFVSGVLISAGQIGTGQGSAGATDLANRLVGSGNFNKVSINEAKVGDVVYMKTKNGHHIVIFAGRDARGKPLYIGSNNQKSLGGAQQITTTGMNYPILGVYQFKGGAPVESGATSASGGVAAAAGDHGSGEAITPWSSKYQMPAGMTLFELVKVLEYSGEDPGEVISKNQTLAAQLKSKGIKLDELWSGDLTEEQARLEVGGKTLKLPEDTFQRVQEGAQQVKANGLTYESFPQSDAPTYTTNEITRGQPING